jgi:hypothetical protein
LNFLLLLLLLLQHFQNSLMKAGSSVGNPNG